MDTTDQNIIEQCWSWLKSRIRKLTLSGILWNICFVQRPNLLVYCYTFSNYQKIQLFPEMLNVVTKLYIFKYSSIIKGKNVNIS